MKFSFSGDWFLLYAQKYGNMFERKASSKEDSSRVRWVYEPFFVIRAVLKRQLFKSMDIANWEIRDFYFAARMCRLHASNSRDQTSFVLLNEADVMNLHHVSQKKLLKLLIVKIWMTSSRIFARGDLMRLMKCQKGIDVCSSHRSYSWQWVGHLL